MIRVTLHPVHFHEFLKTSRHKLGIIIRDKLFRNSIESKYPTQLLYSALGMLSTLECASTTSKNILPSKGPAKSTCTHCHGLVGHNQGCKGEDGGILLSGRVGSSLHDAQYRCLILATKHNFLLMPIGAQLLGDSYTILPKPWIVMPEAR